MWRYMWYAATRERAQKSPGSGDSKTDLYNRKEDVTLMTWSELCETCVWTTSFLVFSLQGKATEQQWVCLGGGVGLEARWEHLAPFLKELVCHLLSIWPTRGFQLLFPAHYINRLYFKTYIFKYMVIFVFLRVRKQKSHWDSIVRRISLETFVMMPTPM